MRAAATEPPLDRVHQPVLAIYDHPMSVTEFTPWMTESDTAAPRIERAVQDWRTAQQTEFHTRVPQATIVVLPGASHYVFVRQPDSVYRTMREFLLSPK